MLNSHIVAWMCLFSLMFLGTELAFAQNYPNRPIRILTAGGQGGSDFTSRLIAQEIDDYSFREGTRAGQLALAIVVGSLLLLGMLSLVVRFA